MANVNANVTVGLNLVSTKDMVLLSSAKARQEHIERTIEDLQQEFPGCGVFKLEATYLIVNDDEGTEMIVEAGGYDRSTVIRGWYEYDANPSDDDEYYPD